MDKYNYVILGSDWDLYKFAYSDLAAYGNVQYIAGSYPPAATLKGMLYRLHFNPSINRFCNLPFKRVWNHTYFKNTFKSEKPLCFLVFGNWVHLEIDIIGYFKKQYPEAKFVWFLQDLISKQTLRFSRKRLDIDALKEQFDLVLSFDPQDCEVYGLIYHPLVFSSCEGLLPCVQQPNSDVYLLGQAKNRLSDIFALYGKLKDCGLKIDMLLAGVAPEDRKYEDEIVYLNKNIAYAENLRHVLQTRCVLEVMQKGGIGFTQRVCEAVCLGRKLLTNNRHVQSEPFFNPAYMSVFTSAEDLDVKFIQDIKNTFEVDYQYKEQMSPVALLNFIEEYL